MMSLGNREGDPTAMILSQENYLSWNHRLTCERWGGDWAKAFSGISLGIPVLFLRREGGER